MDSRDYEPTSSDKLVNEFINKFDGGFSIRVPGTTVFYTDKDDVWYRTPKTKTEFFDMLSQSISQNKNLFLSFKCIFDYGVIE